MYVVCSNYLWVRVYKDTNMFMPQLICMFICTTKCDVVNIKNGFRISLYDGAKFGTGIPILVMCS